MGFDRALSEVLVLEGNYSDHQDDPGGQTKWGITEGLAREYGYNGAMGRLPKRTARAIYHDLFWRPLWCDKVTDRSSEVALELFEAAVNIDKPDADTRESLPVRWLQEWLNLLNRQERDWQDIAEDGIMGPVTLEALDAYLAVRDEPELVAALNSSQAIYYKSIAAHNPVFESFLNGWMKQRIRL
ncbi:hypothetical protein [Salisaeta icosahedral phage 1]|uniref:endolysin n=1 Tax=Salisaeta icosahedral phage 1 TaxID=1183239 RepID=UPI00025EA92C|nr:endolysin [Salisaeta icosahedral phage 1]AFJ21486.1 hypothetical protein [Salisaeta icosahedral phage 1]